jgi:hypothetical protein
VYRSQEAIQSTMPVGMAGMIVAMLALETIYAILRKVVKRPMFAERNMEFLRWDRLSCRTT